MEKVLEANGLDKLKISQKRLEEQLDLLEKRSGKDLTDLSIYLALCFDLCKMIPRTMGFNIDGLHKVGKQKNMAYLQKTYSAPSEELVKFIPFELKDVTGQMRKDAEKARVKHEQVTVMKIKKAQSFDDRARQFKEQNPGNFTGSRGLALSQFNPEAQSSEFAKCKSSQQSTNADDIFSTMSREEIDEASVCQPVTYTMSREPQRNLFKEIAPRLKARDGKKKFENTQ